MGSQDDGKPIWGRALVGNMMGPPRLCESQEDSLMFITTPLPFVQEFVDELHETLVTYQPCAGLSRLQRLWLSFCPMGILVSNAVCWAKCERASLGNYSLAA